MFLKTGIKSFKVQCWSSSDLYSSLGVLLVLLRCKPSDNLPGWKWSLLNDSIFTIKTTKTVTPFSKYKKNWSVFIATKNIIFYYDKTWLLPTAKIIWEKKVSVIVIKQGSENGININYTGMIYITTHLQSFVRLIFSGCVQASTSTILRVSPQACKTGEILKNKNSMTHVKNIYETKSFFFKKSF